MNSFQKKFRVFELIFIGFISLGATGLVFYTAYDTKSTYTEDVTPLPGLVEDTEKIKTEFGIGSDVGIYEINECPGCLARILIYNDTYSEIQLDKSTDIPTEYLLRHELGHLKEPFFWDSLLYFFLVITITYWTLDNFRFKDMRLQLYGIGLLAWWMFAGSEAIAIFYSDMYLFVIVVIGMVFFLGRGLWLFSTLQRDYKFKHTEEMFSYEDAKRGR